MEGWIRARKNGNSAHHRWVSCRLEAKMILQPVPALEGVDEVGAVSVWW